MASNELHQPVSGCTVTHSPSHSLTHPFILHSLRVTHQAAITRIWVLLLLFGADAVSSSSVLSD